MGQVTVKVEYLGLLRNTLGRSEEEITLRCGGCVGDVLQLLRQKHGEQFSSVVFRADGRLRALTQVVVDGEDIRDTGGLERKIKTSNRVISLIVGIYPISGG